MKSYIYFYSAIRYQPSAEVKQKAEEAGEPIPVMFIPRKPHPNCLLIYALSCLVKHSYKDKGIPFILDLLPHLAAGDTAAHDTLFQFKNRWSHDFRPAFVGDAAFMSFEFIRDAAMWGSSGCLFSVANNVLPHLWHVLSANLPDSHWRAAINHEGWVASVHCIKDSRDQTKITYQQILTNLFTVSYTIYFFIYFILHLILF